MRHLYFTRLAIVAVVLLTGSLVARADIPPGPYKSKLQPDDAPNSEPKSGEPRAKPGACGSGVGLVLAGVVAAWGVTWAGQRVLARSRVAAAHGV